MVDFTLTSDPNRICACAREASVFAVKGSCGSVMIFDYKTPGGPRSTLSEETPADGYALEWNPLEENVLGTGGHDGQLSIWDVKATSKIWSTMAHKEPLNDLCYSADGKQLVTVGEDHSTLLWDLRSKKKTMSFQASTEQLSVDWNHHETHQLLTGGKDGLVHVWDMRKVDDPLKSLRGHEQEVVQVKWCPASGEVTGFSPQNFLASACVGGQTILWNLAADSDDAGDGEAPEVLFIHNGHHAAMNDFGWSLLDDFLFCSVALDGFLQFWQPAAIITQDEMPNETGESAAKRLRIDSWDSTRGRVDWVISSFRRPPSLVMGKRHIGASKSCWKWPVWKFSCAFSRHAEEQKFIEIKLKMERHLRWMISMTLNDTCSKRGSNFSWDYICYIHLHTYTYRLQWYVLVTYMQNQLGYCCATSLCPQKPFAAPLDRLWQFLQLACH